MELAEEQADQHFEARMALARLAEGLFSLYGQVGEIENQMREEARIANVTAAIAGGILEDKPTGWLSRAFQQFAWRSLAGTSAASPKPWF